MMYSAPENFLLRAVWRSNDPDLRRNLRRDHFEAGHQFLPDGAELSELLFPLRGVLSLQVVSGSGKQVEIGQVGREGVVGLAQLLQGDQPRLLPVALTA